MTASLLMVGSSLLFALMAVCVKLASTRYGAGEIVLYRGLVGAVFMGVLTAWQGGRLHTPVPGLHLRRSLSGVCALVLWFYAIGQLPLATAITLNYMSSIWMAVFMIGAALFLGGDRVDPRLIGLVALGFAGVALVLRPTLTPEQWLGGLSGLVSGMMSALAYLQVSSLGRAGEPEYRVVFYFSLGSTTAGLLLTLASGTGLHGHDARGLALLVATGVLATTAQLLMTRAYAIGRTLSNASLQYLGIGWSFLFGALWFGEPVTLLALAGIALIIAAGLGATLLRSRPHRSPTQETP